jgi:rhodanese-related sulfurtransferase
VDPEELEELSAEDLRRRLAQADPPVLLDVRESWEHETARIEGCILIPMRELPGRIGELDCERELVVYCHSGQRSRMAGGFLVQNGFCAVAHLRGGIDAWSVSVDPAVPRY